MGNVTLVASGYFELRTVDDDQSIERLAAPGVEGYVLGRSDGNQPHVPDIDLAAHGAVEHGISRRHAALIRFKDTIHIIDLSSANGTFLNGRRLQPEKPYPLQSDAIIKLGTLNLALVKIS